MLPLPLLNVRLRACSEDWQQMMPTAQGHHCAHCNCTVLDFTQATQTDLEAAFQASPDGRVCGQFSAAQLAPNQPQPEFRPAVRLKLRLRRFLVALLLVWGLGLNVGEARAHLRAARAATGSETEPPEGPAAYFQGIYVGQLPVYQDGGADGLMRFIDSNLRQPKEVGKGGRVLVRFTITKEGKVQDAEVVQGLGAGPDAEALRLVGRLGPWTPSHQKGQPVDSKYTVAVTFEAK